MISYFDSSALVKLLVEEDGSELAWRTWNHTDRAATSVASFAEVRAALAAGARADKLTRRSHDAAKEEWSRLTGRLNAVTLSSSLALAAGSFAEEYALRAYDAIHLVTAYSLGRSGVVMVTWDEELARAARHAGLFVAGVVTRAPRTR